MILTIFGTRPEIIKLAPLIPILDSKFKHKALFTSQHYSRNMVEVFFEELGVRKPDEFLNVNSSKVGDLKKAALGYLLKEKPQAVIVYGDTNSTLAAAKAAKEAKIPIIHLEAGLRSRDLGMPEEKNRIEVDGISSLLLCPTRAQEANLVTEGISGKKAIAGNLIADSIAKFAPTAKKTSKILGKLGLEGKKYVLATSHRTENVDSGETLGKILKCLEMETAVVFPVHPRTRKNMEAFCLAPPKNVLIIEPVGYFDFLCLEMHASLIMTDSGGIQEEAILLNVPCITLRDSTERWETIAEGGNFLTGIEPELVKRLAFEILNNDSGLADRMKKAKNPYGSNVAEKIVAEIIKWKKFD